MNSDKSSQIMSVQNGQKISSSQANLKKMITQPMSNNLKERSESKLGGICAGKSLFISQISAIDNNVTNLDVNQTIDFNNSQEDSGFCRPDRKYKQGYDLNKVISKK